VKTVKAVKAVTVKERNKQLEARLTAFSQGILDLGSKLPLRSNLRNQVMKAGTSPGANYIEACESVSARDFVHRIAVCRKEMRETIYWLELIAYAHPELADECSRLSSEADELVKIFSSILEKFKD